MIDSALRIYARNLDYAKRLVADVPPEAMAAQPAPGMNHPAWILGHLAFSCDRIGEAIGLPPALPEPWNPLFDNESRPSSDAAIYPDKAALVEALERGHSRVADAAARAGPDVMGRPLPDERHRAFFPSLGDAFLYMTTSHEAVHLGQLSAWRRSRGMPSV